MILCPLMGAVTYIDNSTDVHTLRLTLIEKYGSNKELASRLRYAQTMVDRLIAAKSGSTRQRSAKTDLAS